MLSPSSIYAATKGSVICDDNCNLHIKTISIDEGIIICAMQRICIQSQVVIRVRPPLPRELQGYRPFENAAMVDPNQRVITLSENLPSLTANGGQAHSPDNGMVLCDCTLPSHTSHCCHTVCVCACQQPATHRHASPAACVNRLASLAASAHVLNTKFNKQKQQIASCTELNTFGLYRPYQTPSVPLVLQVFSTYRFTFDHVYAHDAAQADVYMNSARESVLNALQVQLLLAPFMFAFLCQLACPTTCPTAAALCNPMPVHSSYTCPTCMLHRCTSLC